MKILIKNPEIVNADQISQADILIEDGIIAGVAKNIPVPDSSTIVMEASHLQAFPGGIDPHVHMQLPTPAGLSSDDFLSGSTAAIAGGTTAIIDFVTPLPDQTLMQAFEQRKKEAGKSKVHCGLHMGISGFHENTLMEIKHCIHELGIRSFKVYLAYKSSIGIDYVALQKIMELLASANALLLVHCEEGDEISSLQKRYLAEEKNEPIFHALSRPEYTEALAVSKVLDLAYATGCKTYLVHISSKEAIDIIANRKIPGNVFVETCIQYLILDESNYHKPIREALPYVISPPLRSLESVNTLWKNLSNTIDVVSTDHCPFNTFGQKDLGLHNFTLIPNGAGGVEYRLPLLYTYGVKTRKISLTRFVALTSTNAAKIFGLYPKKGLIAKGSDADIVLWNSAANWTILKENQAMCCDSNIFESFKISGKIEYTLLNGKIITSPK